MDSFDGFDFIDDDFDNFLTKKARQRNKRKRELRKEGASRKEARQQAREEIPRDSLKDVAKKVGGSIGRGVVVGALAVPRASYLSLVAVNYRGLAYKLNAIIELKNGNTEALRNKLKDKWYKLGGNWDKLVKATNNGKRKKPFFCGKKCKKQLAEKGLKRGFVNFNELDFDVYDSFGTGIVEGGVGVWVGLGSTIISSTAGITKVALTNKQEKREMESAERIAQEELKQLSDADKRAYDLELQRLKSSTDPKTTILNNPELSETEKREALKTLDEAEGTDTKNKLIKYVLIGGLVLGGLYFGSKLLKR